MSIPQNTLLAMQYNILWIVAPILLSAIVSYSAYPIIIRISKLKRLNAKLVDRSVHKEETPNLGGVGIFLGIITTLTFIGGFFLYNNLLCLTGALIILFFTGLKDDLVCLTASNKLVGQTLASLSVILITNLRIENFHGLFGIETLPYIASIIFTLFVFILIINAFNLIDGVDGLAGCIAIVISLVFSIYFFLNKNHSYLFIALSVFGSIIPFLYFNFSVKRKIFMGDTGSMLIGFLISYLTVGFLIYNDSAASIIKINSAPAFALALLSFPLADTLRVFIIRIRNGKSPFSADKKHIHHELLTLGFNHWQIALTASLFNVAIVAIVYYFKNYSIYSLIALLVFIYTITLLSIQYFKAKKKRKLRSPAHLSPKPIILIKRISLLINSLF